MNYLLTPTWRLPGADLAAVVLIYVTTLIVLSVPILIIDIASGGTPFLDWLTTPVTIQGRAGRFLAVLAVLAISSLAGFFPVAFGSLLVIAILGIAWSGGRLAMLWLPALCHNYTVTELDAARRMGHQAVAKQRASARSLSPAEAGDPAKGLSRSDP
jgi:hypothetical protein